MNEVILTGYIPADATKGYTPGGAPKLAFDFKTRDSEDVETVQKLIIEKRELVDRYEPFLTSGRMAMIKGELISHPFYERNVLKGYTRMVRVLRAEFPDRTRKQTQEDGAE